MAIKPKILRRMYYHGDILKVVQHYLGKEYLKRHGPVDRQIYIGLCPFHKERTPSFFVNRPKGQCYCMGCGFHATIFQFVQEFDHLSYIEAVFKVAEILGVLISAGKSCPAKVRRRNRKLKPKKKSAICVTAGKLKIHSLSGCHDIPF